ncbi:hypothetical protein CCR95_16440 [Thiocystis minor]|nr:hypothetical protein [Thiocystis minor]
MINLAILFEQVDFALRLLTKIAGNLRNVFSSNRHLKFTTEVDSDFFRSMSTIVLKNQIVMRVI